MYNSNYLNDLCVNWARVEEEEEYNKWMTEEMYNDNEEDNENEEDN